MHLSKWKFHLRMIELNKLMLRSLKQFIMQQWLNLLNLQRLKVIMNHSKDLLWVKANFNLIYGTKNQHLTDMTGMHSEQMLRNMELETLYLLLQCQLPQQLKFAATTKVLNHIPQTFTQEEFWVVNIFVWTLILSKTASNLVSGTQKQETILLLSKVLYRSLRIYHKNIRIYTRTYGK